MHKYLLKRLLLIPPTLFGAAILVFGLMRLVPGDVCLVKLLGDHQAAYQERKFDPNECDNGQHGVTQRVTHADDVLEHAFGARCTNVVFAQHFQHGGSGHARQNG